MRIVITGIAGFTGIHLAQYILSRNNESQEVELYGIDIAGNGSEGVKPFLEDVKFLNCDMLKKEEVKETIDEIRPDKIFHLAGLTFQANPREFSERFYTTNVFGTINLLEAVRELRIDPIIHIACSSAEYGLVSENENPVKETNPLRPLSAYGISKLAQDMVGYQYHKNYGLKIVRTRAFNITGPGERENFVCSGFARQIALIEKGKQEQAIHVGNLEAKRDFVDIRDVVRAYWLTSEKGIWGEVYNICSGKAYSIGEILKILLQMARENIVIRKDPERMRISDIPAQVGSFEKIHKQTGWEPIIPLEETLRDLLDYWRRQVQ